jgi:hypothetical protein
VTRAILLAAVLAAGAANCTGPHHQLTLSTSPSNLYNTYQTF